jgi:Zn-dependent protease with chaperone function
MIEALYFDGRDAEAHRVQVHVDGGRLALSGEQVAHSVALSSVSVGEPFGNAACVADLHDGGHIEVRHGREEFLALLGYQANRIERMQSHWPGALFGLILLLAALLMGYQYGIPAASERLAEAMPESVERDVGQAAEQAIKEQWLQPTRLSDERVRELQALFTHLQAAKPRLPLRLVVSHAPSIRANAFALPNGTIVLSDEMVRTAMGPDNIWDDRARGMIAGVLAHEIAHVEKRHSARTMTRSSLLMGASWAMFGDFSAVAAGLPALLSQMQYSREMETEADQYAVELLRARGYSAGHLADMFEALAEYVSRQGLDAGDELPQWMRDSLSYLGTHPSMADRIADLRELQSEEETAEPPAACGSEQTSPCPEL